MQIRPLPFEYEARYADHWLRLGFDLEQAAILEERDRQLEDYLAGGGMGLPVVVAAADASAKMRSFAHYLCDGADDDAEIQSAIDDCGDGGLVLLVGQTFVLGAPVTVTTGVHLAGQSVRSPVVGTSFNGSAFKIEGGASIERMLIDPAGYFGVGTANTGSAVEAVKTGSTTHPSGPFTQAHWFNMRNVEVITTGAPGLIVDNSGGSIAGNVWVSECPFFRTDPPDYGIEIYNCRHVFILNCQGHSTAGLTGPGTNTGIYIDSDTVNVDIIGGDWIGDIDIHCNAARVIGIDGSDAGRIRLQAASRNSIVMGCMRMDAITDAGTGNQIALNNIGGAAASGIPAAGTTVTSETTYGQSSTAGAASSYSRSDHTHGTPALPTPAAIGAAEDDHTHAVEAGELLMQDGVSSPPVPLETEDGTDWIYEG